MSDVETINSAAKILIIGVGGAGCNAVNRMIDQDFYDVDFYVMNTDNQALASSKTDRKLTLGTGLGAGGDPKVGKETAEAAEDQIREIIKDYDMIFIAAGMGGGTGTGASPVIARIAKSLGKLTIAIVTRPFGFEGKRRIEQSVIGLTELKEQVDSIIVVSNDKLVAMNGNSSMSDDFKEADNVLAKSVKTITDLILMPGVINLDFADVRKTLEGSGIALIGYGQGEGPNKAIDAATSAMACPLLEASINGARRAIVSITCGSKVSLIETRDTVNRIIDATGEDLDIKFGVTINNLLEDVILVSVIATDFAEEYDFTALPKYDFIGTTESKKQEEETRYVEDDDEDHSSILSSFLRRND